MQMEGHLVQEKSKIQNMAQQTNDTVHAFHGLFHTMQHKVYENSEGLAGGEGGANVNAPGKGTYPYTCMCACICKCVCKCICKCVCVRVYLRVWCTHVACLRACR